MQVLLASHSFGANAALDYMAEIDGVDGIVARASGHSPRHMYEAGLDRSAVGEARTAVNGARSDQKVRLTDLNQGQRLDFNLPAELLLVFLTRMYWVICPALRLASKGPCLFFG